jgi:hypothetical protein
LKEGGGINWDNGDVTLIQSGNTLTVAGGDLLVTNGRLLFSKNTGTSTLTALTPIVQIIEADTVRPTLQIQGAGGASTTNPLVVYANSRGTVASPTATQSGDRLGATFAWGYGATTFNTSAGAGFICFATETYTDSLGGSRFDILTTPNGSVTLATAASFGQDKSLTIGGWFGRGAPITKTGNFTLADTENFVIVNQAGATTVTLPAASAQTGRQVWFKTIQAQTLVSNASNVVPNTTATAGTAMLPATDGAWIMIVSDGTNWITMASSTLA